MPKRFNIPRPQINRPQMEVYTSSHAKSWIWYALPSPLTTFYGLLMAGSVTGLAYFFGDLGGRAQGQTWSMISIAVMTGIGLIAGAIRARKEKKKDEESGDGFEAALKQSAAGWDAAVSDPSEIARLDDLRGNFQKGIDTFREYGRDVYSLPWYVIVGEPGSGKSEAIRRSELRFPEALQDKLQGTGGTYSMHWWFTNHAIILDTAGAMLMQPEAVGRFEEFLNLLRSHRPECPINGMILTIPTDSLLQDPPSVAEHKAKTIANQLAVIQKALDVRFPIYIMVSKSDRIPGFREYFDAEGQASFERQMMGWSNPDPLGATFEPERIAEALECISSRLQSRALALLADPIPSQQGARRLDEVDSVYSFPNVIRALAPRLRLYLNVIFQTGAWAAKPPFFRGLFFTSALREGAQLDQMLAQALGMPLHQLPPGGIFTREKAVFLRDMFMEKVFPEQGLVTRLVDVGTHLRRRLMTFYGATAALLLFALGFSLIIRHKLEMQLSQEIEQWSVTNESWNNGALLPLVERKTVALDAEGEMRPLWVWSGSKVLKDGKTTLEFLQDLRERTSQPLSFKWVFWPVAEWRDFLARREEGFLTVFEASVMKPLIDAARERILWDTAEGSTVKSDVGQLSLAKAYEQLLRLEAWIGNGDPPSEDEWEKLLSALVEYSLFDGEPPGGVPQGGIFAPTDTKLAAAKNSVKVIAALAAEVYGSGANKKRTVDLSARDWMSEVDTPSPLEKAADTIFVSTAMKARFSDERKAEIARQKSEAMLRIKQAEQALERLVDERPDGPRTVVQSKGLMPLSEAIESYSKLMSEEKGVISIKLGSEDVAKARRATIEVWQSLGGRKTAPGLERAKNAAEEHGESDSGKGGATSGESANDADWEAARKRLQVYEESFKAAEGYDVDLLGGPLVGNLARKLRKAADIAQKIGAQAEVASTASPTTNTSAPASSEARVVTYLRKFKSAGFAGLVLGAYNNALKAWLEPKMKFPFVDCRAEHDLSEFRRVCEALKEVERDISGLEESSAAMVDGEQAAVVKRTFESLKVVLNIKNALNGPDGNSVNQSLKLVMDAVRPADQREKPPPPAASTPAPDPTGTFSTAPVIIQQPTKVPVGYTNVRIEVNGSPILDQPPTGSIVEVPYNGYDPVKATLTYSSIDVSDRFRTFSSSLIKWPLLRGMVRGSEQFPIENSKLCLRLKSSPPLPTGHWPTRTAFGLDPEPAR